MILTGGLKYRHIDNMDISSIKDKIDSSNLSWDLYDFRQKRYKDHSETKTIPLIWSEDFSEQKIWDPYYSIFRNDLGKVEDILRNKLCKTGGFMSAILINLPAGMSIGRHIDANPLGEKFNRCHRIHIPIITNSLCFFEIGGDVKNMKEGEIWEISNIKLPHSVKNKGVSDRIHLLIDWDPLFNDQKLSS